MRSTSAISAIIFTFILAGGYALETVDHKKAALEVAEYENAIRGASQTALRDVISKTQLSDMLEGREKIDKELLKLIDNRTEPWGIQVKSVEIKDVLIPQSLENAMSMQGVNRSN